ncbi:hypothetical protein LCGC14_2594850 [marine sediment metagenome]|uniref:Uncharacterized protein n=1 Tax=marine sediment metagenome TaxID=412755 RepID=A0A0F9AYF2_9ZZZZ
MTQLDLMDVEHRWPRTKLDRILDIAEKQNLYIQIVDGCVEPGYDDKSVVLGDWNNRETYDRDRRTVLTVNNTPPRLAALFKKLGFAVEWDDEWITCGGCQKAIRCQPDSYSWTQYWYEDGCELYCFDCVLEDPDDYIDYLNGHSGRCYMLDALDLTKYGYELHSDDYENGWHPGQNADPKEIAEQLKKEGITDFIFKLDGKGQFGINFSVWVKR